MKNILKNFKRELLYAILIFVVWEFALIPETVGAGWLYAILILLGSLFVVVWLVSNYSHFAHKGVSEHSEVLIKINLKHRFFAFFITPLLFYLAVSLYIGGIESMFLRQLIIILGTILEFVLFMHIRASYQKIFSFEKGTRFVFQVIDLVLYYIGVTGFVLMGTDLNIRLIGAGLIGFLLLTHQLLIHKQYSLRATVILVLSMLVLIVSSFYFVNFSAVAFPLYMSVVFYLIITVWGIRLYGTTKLEDYITPVLFSLMALMILFSF